MDPLRRLPLLLAALLAVLILAMPIHAAKPRTATDWLTYGFDVVRSGHNPAETTLNLDNVPFLSLLWSSSLGVNSTFQPLYASAVRVADGTLDLVFVGTDTGDLIALDALNGIEMWRRNVGVAESEQPCGDALQKSGVTGTAAIDRETNRVYVVGGLGEAWALDLGSGEPISGWPVRTLDRPGTEKVWSAVTMGKGTLYVTTSSYCDQPPYQGRIVAVDTVTATRSAVLFLVPPEIGLGSGVWGYGGVSVDPASGKVYAATSRAIGVNENLGHAHKVLELSADLKVLSANDPGIPSTGDYDFGTTPIHYQASGCPPQIALTNKLGLLYIYERDAIASGPVQEVTVSAKAPPGLGLGLVGLAAYWPAQQMVYSPVKYPSDDPRLRVGVVAFKVGADCRLSQQWNLQVGEGVANVSSTTVANGVGYIGSGELGALVAFDAATGNQLWSVPTGGPVYVPPIVANGRLYAVSYGGRVFAYAVDPYGVYGRMSGE